MSEWRTTDTCPEGVEVMTKIDDEKGCRNETTLTKRRNLWWYPDGSMYVYYTPTHWMPAHSSKASNLAEDDDNSVGFF